MAATKVPPPKKQREAPPALEQTSQNLEKTPPFETETLNFKVASEFKREYKGYAVSRGMNMVKLLKESFELYKERNGS
jgi:hypothetical protein